MSPRGKLYVPGAESIVPNLARLTRSAAERPVLIVASADAHQPNDAEFRQWPPHCLAGTPGQRKIPETLLPRRLVIPNSPVELPADPGAWQQIVLEKQELNVFTNPNTEPLLRRLGRPEVVLYGVVTELCVALAAENLLRHDCAVTLVEDATASLDAAKARSLVDRLVRQGARLATTEEIV
jgi:nicotinamidase/pyrazinamidase